MAPNSRGRYACALVMGMVLSGTVLVAAHLQPESVTAWTAYAAATERRIATELAGPGRFLVMDFASDAAAERRDVLGGRVVVRGAESRDERGRKIDVPSALIHHWRGAVLLPNTTLDRVMTTLQGDAPVAVRGDVLKATVLGRGPEGMRLFLRLQRQEVVTAVFNTEHLVTFRRDTPSHATSRSVATRIAEVADAGTAREHELTPGDDRGFLWRLNAYWRYEEVSGGVVAECESISLSRGVPAMLKVFVMPVVNNAAEDSMARTLRALRERFAQ